MQENKTMERLKRIDEKLMSWITARPYGHKMDPEKHSKLIALMAIMSVFSTLDIFLNGWGIIRIMMVLVFWPSAFYEWRLWRGLRAEAEMEGG